jgi:dihydroorotate dehydrogenase (NAD+) catalytic subunit
VIGLGGITNAIDALEFLLVGAKAVQVGTANFSKPGVSLEIIKGIKRFLEVEGLGSIKDYIGSLDIDCAFPFAEESCSLLDLGDNNA